MGSDSQIRPSRPPRAYKLLVGLSEVNPNVQYYASRMNGFDGKRGCEGAAIDIQRMNTMTHYLGFESISLRPLWNETATGEAVLGYLEQLAELSGDEKVGKQDIFFLYFTCHGRSVAIEDSKKTPQEEVTPQSTFGAGVNYLLLHDGPLLNLHVLAYLTRLPCRIFTIFDCCHAGLGTALDEGENAYFRGQVEQINAQLPRPQAGGRVVHFEKLNVKSLFLGILGNLTGELVHYGAARDQLTALGGDGGSQFTSTLRSALMDGGSGFNYFTMFNAIAELLQMVHQPVMEVVKRGGLKFESFRNIPRDFNCSNVGNADHFACCETPFKI